MFILLTSEPPSSIDPRGPAASNIADLWWVMLFLSAAIFLLVVGLMLYGLFFRRDSEATDEGAGKLWILLGGIVMPAIVLAVVFVLTIRTSISMANETDPDALRIEVTGRRWWWEVDYPQQGVTTANEIHIPVGEPVELVLISGDVIHSFWVPQLQGKMDLIPGRENTLVIEATESGVYRGECAEYCGLQHARMHFMVIAQNSEDFEQWLSVQQQPAAEPDNGLAVRGQEVFVSAGCIYCHNIQGLNREDVDPSAVDLGPDLTHLASRTTIGAGALENNRGNLGGWIANPHSHKPGVLMPANFMSGEDLQALLAYLQTLR